jgi:hypothetical protein
MQGRFGIAWRIREEPVMGLPDPRKCEARMLTKEIEHIHATLSIRVVEGASEDGLFQAQQNGTDDSAELCGGLFEFAGNAPATFAERFPRLMVCAVAIALIVSAITVEIECLRGAGYYWP